MGKENNENNKYTKDERRELRRQRRIRNQVIAYLVLIILLAGIGYGGYKGALYLMNYFGTNNQPVVDVVDTNVTVSEDNFGVISSPEEPIDIEITPEEPELTEEEIRRQELMTMIDSMTLEQKVANLFIVSPEAITGVEKATRAGDGTKAALEQYAVGGIIYAGKNVNGADQFREMVMTTKDMYHTLYNSDLWIMVQEDGSNSVIAGSATGIQKIDTAASIGESGDSGNAYTAYIDVSRALNNYGVNMNLSPVCDVATAENSFLGNSSFSSDADIVSSMVRQAVNAEEESGIMACLMAFPGQGSVSSNPAKGEVSTDRTLDDMRTEEFLPFQAGIEGGAEVIVVSHLIAENASGENVPCSLSAVMINDVLKGELGFTGVVITDRMNQPAITAKYSSGEASVMAIQAGADMILEPENFEESYQAVIDAVNNGTISEERINESLLRIYEIKTAE